MRPRNQGHIASVGRTIAVTADRLVEPVQGMHRAISRRWFSLAGPVAEPVRIAHDLVSDVVYSSIRGVGAVAGVVVDHWAAPKSHHGLEAALSAVWDDKRLGRPMTIRTEGEPLQPHQIAAMIPGLNGRLVVLVHGLGETERSWAQPRDEPSLLGALSSRPDLTPLTVRYSSGRSVADNAAELTQILETFTAQWPVPVESIALVGNSMGGLVIRGACVIAEQRGLKWLTTTTDVITIGTPHRGAPLEKLANIAAWGLSLASVTKPLAEFLNGRSAGIKDLRYGAISDSDWDELDRDALLRNTVETRALPAGIQHHFVVGTVMSDPAHPVSAVVGDLAVRRGSAEGRDRLEPANVVTIGGTRHSDLRHDPRVIQHLMGWLE